MALSSDPPEFFPSPSGIAGALAVLPFAKAEPETGPVSETTAGGVQGEHVPCRTGGDVAGLGGRAPPG